MKNKRSKKTKRRLYKFFAVTTTSIYEVKGNISKKSNPVAKKIALRGESAIQVGGCLDKGKMIAVCTQLIPYIPEKYGSKNEYERKIENVGYSLWKGHTSSIIALFSTKRKAFVCFNSPNLEHCDQRWINETKKVLERIGDDNPVFYISRDKHLGLRCAL